MAQSDPDAPDVDDEEPEGRLQSEGVPPSGPATAVIRLSAVEPQLLLADRLAKVGAVAAGVAHEVNNPLGYAIANLGFALEEIAAVGAELAPPEGESPEGLSRRVTRARAAVQVIVDALQEARHGADRVRLLMRDLRTFSRADDERTGPLDVRRVLESSVNVAYNHISPRARLVKDYGTTPLVDGNETRLGQVFVNLLVNAAQAIVEGDSERQMVRVVTRTDADGQCVVEISDTGHGIAALHLPRIFEPFFTTKPAVGAGLGLAVCQHVVDAMGGRIRVDTREGEGSTFRIVLPATGGDLAVLRTSIPPPSKPLPVNAVRGRILVVDDEPMMVRAIQRLLEGEHDVFSTTDPVDAVAQVRSGARFDAILCDLMMPAMSGMDVFEAVRRIAPEQARRIVFMTGGAFTDRVQQFLESVDNIRIEKPIERATLRAAIRAQLES